MECSAIEPVSAHIACNLNHAHQLIFQTYLILIILLFRSMNWTDPVLVYWCHIPNVWPSSRIAIPSASYVLIFPTHMVRTYRFFFLPPGLSISVNPTVFLYFCMPNSPFPALNLLLYIPIPMASFKLDIERRGYRSRRDHVSYHGSQRLARYASKGNSEVFKKCLFMKTHLRT